MIKFKFYSGLLNGQLVLERLSRADVLSRAGFSVNSKLKSPADILPVFLFIYLPDYLWNQQLTLKYVMLKFRGV